MLRVLVVWLMVLSMAGCASFGGDDVDDIVDELEDLAKEAEDGFYAVSTALGVLLCALPPDERRQWSAEIRQCQRPEDIECNGPAPFDFPGLKPQTSRGTGPIVIPYCADDPVEEIPADAWRRMIRDQDR